MRNRMLIVGVVLGLGLVMAFGTQASAQYETLGKGSLSVHAGVFFPNDSDAKDAESDAWFTAGANWTFYKLPSMGGMGTDYHAHLCLSVDYYGSGELYSVPVLVNYHGQANRFFYGAGAGIAFNKQVDTVTGSTFSTEDTSDFAYAVFLGFDVMQGPTPIYVMAKWNGGSDSKMDGFSAVVGVRF